jgi:phage terminase small subunit
MGKLTEKQERFVVVFATIRNGTQAAINAGYSKKVAGIVACKLLKRPDVMAILHRIKAKDEKKFELTRERVLNELAKGLFRDPVGLEDAEGIVVSRLKDIPLELRTIIDSFKVTQMFSKEGEVVGQKIEVKLIPKAAAIDMGMKHLGAYAAEKQETKVSLDWEQMYGRSSIIDPAEDAIKKMEDET